jgi:hypothetical protein
MCRPCLYTAHVYRDDVTFDLGRYYIYGGRCHRRYLNLWGTGQHGSVIAWWSSIDEHVLSPSLMVGTSALLVISGCNGTFSDTTTCVVFRYAFKLMWLFAPFLRGAASLFISASVSYIYPVFKNFFSLNLVMMHYSISKESTFDTDSRSQLTFVTKCTQNNTVYLETKMAQTFSEALL